MMADMKRSEARMDEIPEHQREIAGVLWSWLASRALGELEERVIALETADLVGASSTKRFRAWAPIARPAHPQRRSDVHCWASEHLPHYLRHS
jgi:hypothetical protein